MKSINYIEMMKTLLQPDIVSMLSRIHEYKGEQMLFIDANQDELSHLVEIARIQSADASNRIEGIYTSDERLKKLVMNKTMPRDRSEQEIAGYREALCLIHEKYDYMPLKTGTILQIHKILYKFFGSYIGGSYKNVENNITEEDAFGNKTIRFETLSAWETPEAMQQICQAFDEALRDDNVDPLLLIPMFILDFLCIHPFKDGNGRMSRLLTLLLLYRSGYIVGKYVSIEKAIEITKNVYYDSLYNSSQGWYERENDYGYFVRYLLGVILSAYRDFADRVKTLATSGLSKPERIRNIIKDTFGSITKAEIMKQCPDISQVTVQRTLADLMAKGEIKKISGGRYTSYTWNRENEV